MLLVVNFSKSLNCFTQLFPFKGFIDVHANLHMFEYAFLSDVRMKLATTAQIPESVKANVEYCNNNKNRELICQLILITSEIMKLYGQQYNVVTSTINSFFFALKVKL